MGQAFLCPVVRSQCPVLPVIVLQLFPLRDNLQIYGRQDFASVIETTEHHSATNASDIITVRAGTLATKLQRQ